MGEDTREHWLQEIGPDLTALRDELDRIFAVHHQEDQRIPYIVQRILKQLNNEGLIKYHRNHMPLKEKLARELKNINRLKDELVSISEQYDLKSKDLEAALDYFEKSLYQ